MKIEKLSDSQIRCTLNKSDLASRELKISELAYGSEKAKDLFRDMMQQASYELGFEADDIPLMIEAIPVSPDCIILIITKVDDPEELDTRFSKFAPPMTGDDEDDSDLPYDDDDTLDTLIENTIDEDNGADDVINLFSKVKDYLNKNIERDLAENKTINVNAEDTLIFETDKPLDDNFIPLNQSLKNVSSKSKENSAQAPSTADEAKEKAATQGAEPNVSRIFSFNTLDHISNVAIIITKIYNGQNSLYKDSKENKYYLLVEKSDCSPTVFNKVCNILSEYGTKEQFVYSAESYFNEHLELIIKDKAIQILATI